MAGVVPSILHQCLKFKYDHQEMVIHSERGHPIYAIKEKKGLGGEIFYTLELVRIIKIDP